jgi:hypothetical protein
MFSADIIYAVLVVIVLILGLTYMGRFFEKLSPKTLKYIDYGSFAMAGISGALIYFGQGNAFLRYIFLASIVIYFVTLRHTIHTSPSTQD